MVRFNFTLWEKALQGIVNFLHEEIDNVHDDKFRIMQNHLELNVLKTTKNSHVSYLIDIYIVYER